MNSIEFARTLFTLRMERKLTVEELAEAMNVAPGVICEWECAKTSPSLDTMNKLAKFYGIPLDEIIRNPKPKEIPKVEAKPPEEAEPEPAPEEAPAPEAVPVTEASPAGGRRGKKRKIAFWEILIIVLLLAIIGAAVFFLFRPDLFPLPDSAVLDGITNLRI